MVFSGQQSAISQDRQEHSGKKESDSMNGRIQTRQRKSADDTPTDKKLKADG
jgi:hypothetical protein